MADLGEGHRGPRASFILGKKINAEGGKAGRWTRSNKKYPPPSLAQDLDPPLIEDIWTQTTNIHTSIPGNKYGINFTLRDSYFYLSDYPFESEDNTKRLWLSQRWPGPLNKICLEWIFSIKILSQRSSHPWESITVKKSQARTIYTTGKQAWWELDIILLQFFVVVSFHANVRL